MNLADAKNHAHRTHYRAGWDFSVDANGYLCARLATCSPLDPTMWVVVTRNRFIPRPFSRETMDHLTLDLIDEIERHERLEWLWRGHENGVRTVRIFPPHTPTSEDYRTVEGFLEGERVYERHRKFMEGIAF